MSYINFESMSDGAIAQKIGLFVKESRLEQNRSQASLAKDAGLSRSTLSLLEKGEPVNLMSLIQVLRVLQALQVLSSFHKEPVVSPIKLAEMEHNRRKRASKSDASGGSKWHW